MGLRSFISSVGRLLKLARKPSKGELWLSMKICLLGIAAVGIVGFVIKFVSFSLQTTGA